MSTVYRTSDRIDIKIDSVVFTVSPMDYKTKADIQSNVIAGRIMDAAVVALKNSVKDVKGLKNYDGSQYSLEFDENKILTDECINDLLNISESDKLSLVAVSLTQGMPKDQFTDDKGRPVEGVSIVKRKASSRKK
jgi:hypothetical protein